MRWEGPWQCVAERVNYMWPTRLLGKTKNSTRKIASALPLPSLTASCFQLFSPAGRCSQDELSPGVKQIKSAQVSRQAAAVLFCWLLGPWTPSAHLAPALSLPRTLRAAGSFCELWSCLAHSACDNNVLLGSAYQASGSLPPHPVQLILITRWLKVCGYFFSSLGICLIPNLTFDKSLGIKFCVFRLLLYTQGCRFLSLIIGRYQW